MLDDVDPSSTTLAQHQPSIGSTSRVCWIGSIYCGAPHNYGVHILQLNFLETEEDVDVMQVLVGGPTESTSHVIAQLSGDLAHRNFYSNNQYMIVKFYTDATVTGRGFNAKWEAGEAFVLARLNYC